MNKLTPEASALDSLVTEIIGNSAIRNLTWYSPEVVSRLVGEMPLVAKKSAGALALVCQALPVMPIEEGGIWPQVAGQVCQTMTAGRDSRAVLLREYFKRRLSHDGSAGIGAETNLSWRLSGDDGDWRRADALHDLFESGVVKIAQRPESAYVAYELSDPIITAFGDAFAAAAFGLTGMDDPRLEEIKPEIARAVHPGWFLDK